MADQFSSNGTDVEIPDRKDSLGRGSVSSRDESADCAINRREARTTSLGLPPARFKAGRLSKGPGGRTGLLCFVMAISSPRATRSSSRERWVFATKEPTASTRPRGLVGGLSRYG